MFPLVFFQRLDRLITIDRKSLPVRFHQLGKFYIAVSADLRLC
jgi:hypothetical protein